ncbi:MAG: hypothetical protein ACYTGZ_16445 [Planctomycetota bacterium]|jgi:hypothetical protein
MPEMECRIALVLLVLAAWAAAQDAKPLPLRKSVILPSGGHYFVEGRQEIVWGQELSVQKNTRIVGRGEGATLVVSGALQVRGVRDSEVVLENLNIEVAEKCERVHLDTVQMGGGSIRTAKGKSCFARVHLEKTNLNGTEIDLLLYKGEVTVHASQIKGPVRLVAVPEKGKKKAAVKALFNTSNLDRDLTFLGVNSLVVRACGLAGQQVLFRDCATLTFDANVCKSPSVVMEQTAAGKFKKTKIQKSDFINCKLILKAPRVGKKKDKIPVDKCFFGGRTKKKDILGRDIHDGHTDETSGAFVVFRKINDRALGLGGYTSPYQR